MLPLKEIILLGVGHTNAHVLRMWRMQPMPGVRLTCISDFPVATYSGMLPGVLAEQYPPSRMQIDLVRLCAAAGARLILGEVVGLDTERGAVQLSGRPPLPFDILSIGIGSRPSYEGVRVEANTHLLPIKPMQTFLDRLEERLEIWRGTGRAICRVVVVGGGAGGVEIAFCLERALTKRLGSGAFELTLVQGGSEIVSGLNVRSQANVHREFERRNISQLLGRRVVAVEHDAVVLEDGTQLSSDLTIWATSASPPPLLAELGLPRDERGFLRTLPTLQSIGDARVFAVGDSGSIENEPLPKAGVYAVRQGPVLWTNMYRLLSGQRLVEYRPQRRFLKLLNLGDGRAVADYRGLSAVGQWCWRWKDRIDSRFMDMYQDYRPMTMIDPEPSRGMPPMRCLGCGGKIGAQTLRGALERIIPAPDDDGVVMGLDSPDDAAVVRAGSESIVVSVDHFQPPLDDLYLVGRIAALNALSDLWAMGTRPTAALASVTISYGSPARQQDALEQLLAGAVEELRRIGTPLVGGHTIEGQQSAIGLTVLGRAGSKLWRKGELQVGDRLGITKPLGTGILLAAHMQAALRAEWWEPLLAAMLTSNQAAFEALELAEPRGVTDVTGFGLAGHLHEMLSASRLGAELWLDRIPLLPGADELLLEGWESSLAPENRHAEQFIDVDPALRTLAAYRVLFDPQTSGGLLFGIPAERQAVIERAIPVYWIGRVTRAGDEGVVIKCLESRSDEQHARPAPVP